MNINSQLDDLFERWEKEPRFKDGNFFRDGAINENLFQKQKVKILFIAKEPNYVNHREQLKDFRIQWNKNIPNYRIAKQIATLAHGILNDFPLYNSFKPTNEDLKAIAFMNIKKSAGGSVSIFNDFKKYFSEKNHLDYVRRQIDIINPDLILLGLTWDSIRNTIFDGYKWMDSGLGIKYTKINNTTVIDYYHPSSMIPPNVNYYFLKTVLEKIL